MANIWSPKEEPATEETRDSGIDFVGSIPWGTHLCQFYQTKEDLTDVLVPYFKAGLENNEFCMWVTSDPLSVEEARAALSAAVRDLDARIESLQMEIVPHSEWYLKGGYFDMERVFSGWIGKLEDALARGFEGLRATGNTAWLEESNWNDFVQYEEELNRIIGDYRMMAVCTYSLDLCSACDIIDVIANHQFALIRRAGIWELIESSELKRTGQALRESEKNYRLLFENMLEGFSLCKMVFDDDGDPVDFVYLATNKVFESLTGLENVVGKSVTEVIPGIRETNPELLETYGRVVSTGKPEQFEARVAPLSIDLFIKVFRPMKDCFAAVFENITERKRTEDELKRANNELEAYASIVSHDLKGPVAAVTSASSTIEELVARCQAKQDIEQVMEVTDLIKRSSLSALALIDNLLSLARAGQTPSKVSKVAVRKTVEKVLEEKAVPIEEKKIKVTTDDDLGSIMADPTHIYQLFANVIGNAIAYNDNPYPEIWITHKEEDGTHRYRIRDNGSGIPPDDTEKIFLPLFRGKKGDTGIGLAIVKKIVNMYGGDIKVYNDGGACFEFTIKDFHPKD